MSRRRHRLMEPMLCSLTSGRRSFAGVTQQNVDRWVDSVFASVFTQPFVRCGAAPVLNVCGGDGGVRSEVAVFLHCCIACVTAAALLFFQPAFLLLLRYLFVLLLQR
jgi:hypothetical protein